jgi:hypothetical protein
MLSTLFTNAEEPERSDWILRKDKVGIQVYSRKIEGLAYREFRGIVELESTLAASLALLDDADACVDWLYRCESARVLQRTGIAQRHVYQVSDLPFPAATRDVIVKVELQEYKANSIRVVLQSAPDFIEATSFVRIRESYGTYLLQQLDEHHLRLTWTQYIDPEGRLPAFMVNALLTDVPFNSLRKFSEIVKKEKYRQARFIFDDSDTPIDLIYGEPSS